MPIFICKNCGNLTECEATLGLTCAHCGASLDQPPQQSAPQTRQPIRVPTPPDRPESHPYTPHHSADQSPSESDAHTSGEPDVEPTDDKKRDQSPIDLPETVINPPSRPTPAIAGVPAPPSDDFMGEDNEFLEAYENKNLVGCPSCGYGCDPSWAKCPICETELPESGDLPQISESDYTFNEEELKQKLIACPKCNYACDPSWDDCPICQTPLKKSE